MKKSILALLAVSALSTSAFATTGTAVQDKLHFNEEVVRVCGIEVGRTGSIIFKKETNDLGDVSATFKVYDNGAHEGDGQARVSISTDEISTNLEKAGLTKNGVMYSINNKTNLRSSLNKTPMRVGSTQEVYATVPLDAANVDTGVAEITAIVEVHCGN